MPGDSGPTPEQYSALDHAPQKSGKCKIEEEFLGV
jgi:hypothetical protein